MYKPLMHLLLPRWVPRVILLDSDLFMFADVVHLWRVFETFGPQVLAGFAEEQSPWNRKVERLGGFSANGGVQLLHLQRMRTLGFSELLYRYAHGELPLDGEVGLGVVGDQTLYSWMSINGTPAQRHIVRLPCSWNVQAGAWPSTVSARSSGDRRWGRHCGSGCNVLHGNGVWGKLLLRPLMGDPTGRSCAAAFARWEGTFHYRKGTPSEALLIRTGKSCCAAANRTSGTHV